MSKSTEAESSRNQEIAGHRYDGIREYDNPMPGWWVWLFWGSIVFSIVYYLGIGPLGFIDTYEEDLDQSLAELQSIRASYLAANPSATVDSSSLAMAVADPARVSEGAVLYAAQCAACHGPQGQGLIGPNVSDEFWIHGGTNMDLFTVVSQGVVAKGMPPWEAIYTTDEMGSLIAFIRSLAGTNPPNPKEPQGERFESGVPAEPTE